MFEWISNLWEDFKSSDFVKEIAEFAIGEQDSMSKDAWNKKATQFANDAMVPFQILGTPGRFISENLAAGNIFVNYLRTNPSEYFLNPTKMWDDYFRARDAAIGNRDGLDWYEEGSNKITYGQAFQGIFDPGLDFENMTEQDRINYFDDGMAKWFSGTADLVSLFATDPFTYVTGGTVAAVKGGVTGAAKGLIKGGVAATGKAAVSGAKRALFSRRMTEIVRRADEQGLSNQQVIELARRLGATMKLDDELGKELIPYDFSGKYLGMDARDVPAWMRPKAAVKDSDDVRSLILNAENTVADPLEALRMILYPKRDMVVVQGTVEYTDLVMRMFPRFSGWENLTSDFQNIVPNVPGYSYFSEGNTVWASDGIDLFEFIPNKVPFKKRKTKNGIWRKPNPGSFRPVKSLPAFQANSLIKQFEREGLAPDWMDQDEAFLQWAKSLIPQDVSLSGTGSLPKDFVSVMDDILNQNPELNINELNITQKEMVDSLKFLFERSFDESFPNVNLNTVSSLHDIEVFPLVIGNVTSETGSIITKPIRFDISRTTKLPAGTRFATVKLRVPIKRTGAKRISETRDLGELGIATGQPSLVKQPDEVIPLKRNIKKNVPVTYTSKVKTPGSTSKGRKDIIEQVETGVLTVPGERKIFDYQYVDPETGVITLIPEGESIDNLYKIITVPLAIVPTSRGIPKVYRLATFRRTVNQSTQKEIPVMTDIEVDEFLLKNPAISLIDEADPNYIKNISFKRSELVLPEQLQGITKETLFKAILKNISTRDAESLTDDMRVFLRLEDPEFQAVQSDLDAVRLKEKQDGIQDSDFKSDYTDYMLTEDGKWVDTKTGEIVSEDVAEGGAQSYTDIVDEFYEYLAREQDNFEFGEGAFDEAVMGEPGISITSPTEKIKGLDPKGSRNAWVQIEGLRPQDFVGFEYPHYNPFTGRMKTVTIPREYTLVKDMGNDLMRLVFRNPEGKLYTLDPFDRFIPVEKFNDSIKLWEATQVEVMSLLASAVKLVEKRGTNNVFIKEGWSQVNWRQLSEGELVPGVAEDFVPERTVFVFGSNLQGIHGKGAALEAKEKYGAIQGKGVGLHGDSYALPTKRTPSETLSLEEIKTYVDEFLKVAEDNPNVLFDVTDFGTGLAGYSPEQIASLFNDIDVPPNLRFGPKLRDLIKPSTRKRNLKLKRTKQEKLTDVGARFVETRPDSPYKTTIWFNIIKGGRTTNPTYRMQLMRSIQFIEKDWAGGYRPFGDPEPDEIIFEWVLDESQMYQFEEKVKFSPFKQMGYTLQSRETRTFINKNGEEVTIQPLTIKSDEWDNFNQPVWDYENPGQIGFQIQMAIDQIFTLTEQINIMFAKPGGAKAIQEMRKKRSEIIHYLYGPLYKSLESKIGKEGQMFTPARYTARFDELDRPILNEEGKPLLDPVGLEDDGFIVRKPSITDAFKGKQVSAKEYAFTDWIDTLNKMFGTTVARVPKPDSPEYTEYAIKNFVLGYGKDKSTFGVHSGGADGADTIWAEEASKIGIPTYAYGYKGMWGFKGTRPKLEERIDLTFEELKRFNDTLAKVADTLGKKLSRVSERNGVIYRNAYQVEESDAVIAVSTFGENATKTSRRTVSGGTGWAVEYGILKGKPVYLFDLDSKKWFEFNIDTEDWVEVDMPPVFSHFAGVGTREITPAGKKAIRDYLQKVKEDKGELLDTSQPSVAPELSKPITPAATTDPVKSMIVTRSTPEEFDRLITSGEGVYIGRAGKGQSGEFGNPFKVPNGATDEEVKDAVEKYRKWLWQKIQQDPEYAAKLYKLKGKKLACPGTEKPELCHGNVIARAIEWLGKNDNV